VTMPPRSRALGLVGLVVASGLLAFVARRGGWASPYEVLAVFLSAGTLYWLIVYTGAAIRTADAAIKTGEAANEQAEALQRPCVVLIAVPRDDATRIMDAPNSTKLPPGNVTARNIGPGPALELSVFSERKAGDTWKAGLQFDLPYLEPGTSHGFVSLGAAGFGEWKLTLAYGSMSGRRYLTLVSLQDGAFTASKFRPMSKDDILPVPEPSPWEKAQQAGASAVPDPLMES
jgi:hypothetical protein